jgi:indolepyruvate ferredoxin oxidoreductase alpha subunit
MSDQLVVGKQVLLGDEAVALGAVHAGITAAYAYPGTPSTEITEYLINYKEKHGAPHAAWCANEKTAFEEALGTSFAGRRALVSMKHVGLNVAADPFINGAIVNIHGGLVLCVADDPGMHSSQNEQDSRYLADFARVICLEPATQQEAYDMTREAFDLSERFHTPVVIRVVTHIAHSRAVVELRDPREQNPLSRVPDPQSWILLPVNARRQWENLTRKYTEMETYAAEETAFNRLELEGRSTRLGVITTGTARNYYLENEGDMDDTPAHLHIGAYPMPAPMIRELVDHVDRVLVLEEGYPYVERCLRGIIQPDVEISGRMDGAVPTTGELTPSIVRTALGMEIPETVEIEGLTLPGRPPQLCTGCPHRDSYDAIRKAAGSYDTMVTSDIGCYTLGALPPYSAIETCVCMGASIGIAKGASEAGFHPVLAVIGDSTFLHSGVTPLMDAVANNTNMTLMILDNETVAMTGTQPTILANTHLKDLLLGIGVDPDHLHVFFAHPRKVDEHAEVIRKEIEYDGLSVVVMVRECLEHARRRKQEARRKKQ